MRLQSKERYCAATCSLALILTAAACQGKTSQVNVSNSAETAPHLISTVRMNDTAASAQLLSGFYAIEHGAWRWTAGNFSIRLPAPPSVADRGAVLTFNFNIPEVVIQRLKEIKLTAAINGSILKSADYSVARVETFTASVPASLVTGDSVEINFSVDKVLPPDIDKRALGVIANFVSLSAR
jgi:hypothetical protein